MPDEQEQPEVNYHCEMTNTICLGEITLSSPFMNMDQLLVFLKKMLNDDDIKKYLQLLKTKKAQGSYFG